MPALSVRGLSCLTLAISISVALSRDTSAHPQVKHPPAESEKPAARPAPRDLPLEGAVLKTLAEYRSALEARDLRRLGELFHREAVVIDGETMSGWDDYLVKRLGPDTRSWKSFRFEEPKITRVLALGDHVLAVQEAVWRIELSDKTIAPRVTETLVFSRTGAAWQITHLHRTPRPLEAAP